LVRAGVHHCGLPLPQVVEVCRALPLQAWGNAPPYVLGLARVRGEAVPVVDLRLVLGGQPLPAAARFVSLRVDQRRIALAVDEVLGLGSPEASTLSPVPPLLAPDNPAVDSLSALDPSLLLLLRAARLFPIPS
jgi:purine-binding chemotaxis protein CheW